MPFAKHRWDKGFMHFFTAVFAWLLLGLACASGATAETYGAVGAEGAALRAQQKRAERRRNLLTIGAITAAAAVIIGGVAWYAATRSSGASAEVIPPVGGPHNATWMNCGIYGQPVPNERAVHNLEHGAVWITYQPSLPPSQVSQLRALVDKQTMVPSAEGAASRYMDLSPYPGLPAPIVVSSWGFQLKLSSPTDSRLQQFVNKFRASATYTPEYGGACTGGVGTPLQK